MLSGLLTLSVLAPTPESTQEAPLWTRAFDAQQRGHEIEPLGWLLEELPTGLVEGAYGTPRAEADAVVACIELLDLARRLDAYPEVVAALEPTLPWPDDAPPEIHFWLARTYAEALSRVGRVDEAQEWTSSLGYFDDYQAIGPFDNERGGGYSRAFPPESSPRLGQTLPGKERPVTWRPVPGRDHPLDQISPGTWLRPRSQVCAYLATAIHTEEARSIGLNLASSGSYRVFLNRNEVLGRPVERNYGADQDRVVLHLAAGWNQLLIKTCVEEGPWRISTRLTDLDGRAVEGLKIDSNEVRKVDRGDPLEGQPDRFIRARTTLEGLPDDPLAQSALAVYLLLANPEDFEAQFAAQAARAALAVTPNDARARYLLALALRPSPRASREEIAINPYLEALRRTLELDPGNVAAMLDLGGFYMGLHEVPAKADAWTRRAAEAAPESWRALTSRGAYLQSRGREDEAWGIERRILASPSARPRRTAALWRAKRSLGRGDAEGAASELRKALERVHAPGDTFEQWALLQLSRAGSPEEASGALERVLGMGESVLRSEPDDLETLLYLASLCMNADRADAGHRWLDRAESLCPEDVRIHDLRVTLHEMDANPEAAAESLGMVLELEPGNDRARRHRQLVMAVEEERFENPWRRDALEWVDTPLPEASQNDIFEVLDRSTVYRVYPDGAESHYEHLVMRILNLRGIQEFDRLPIIYPRAGRLQVYQVRVIHGDGSVEPAPAPMGRDPVQGTYAGRIYDLPTLAVGDIIDLEYRVDETEPDVFGEYFGTRHTFYPDRVDGTAPTRRAELVVVAPETLPLHAAVKNGDALEYTESAGDDGSVVHHWVARDLGRPAIESAMPRREEIVPVVDVTTYEDWGAFGDWWWSFIEKEFVTTPAMRQKVEELTAGLESEEEKVEAIVRFVGQEIRYNAWAFGTHGYEPFSASTIFDRRFGDCKDKSILLRQLLAEIDVDAVPVLIKAEYNRAQEDLEAAMVGSFNHCIAYVTPTEDREGYYVDATADLNPLDYLRADDQGARVLHVTPEGSSIHEIPYATAEENSLRRRYEVDLRRDGGARVRLVDESVGNYGVLLRSNFGGEQGDLRQKLASVLRSSFGTVEFEEVETSPLEDISTPARLEARFDAAQLASNQGGMVEVPISFDPVGLEGLAVETPEERSFDVALDRPIGVETRVRWTLPAGARIERQPEDVRITVEGLVDYSVRFTRTDGGFQVDRKLQIRSERIPRERYGEFREAIQDIRQAEERVIVIEPGTGGEQ